MEKIQYCIFDPTGNITALVETAVDVADQPAIAARIMELEPDVEQVGFITYAHKTAPEEGDAPVSLRMAGGEFCGNATMCAAALYAIHNELRAGEVPVQIKVRVSGATEPLAVSLQKQAAFSFGAAVMMPPALRIGMVDLPGSGTAVGGSISAGSKAGPGSAAGGPGNVGAATVSASGISESPDPEGINAMLSLPIVEMEGISHIIIEPGSGFLGIKDDSALAESLLRQWCGALGSDCLGLMFLSEPRGGEAPPAVGGNDAADPAAAADDARIVCERALTPLVYVPGADTMFWENSCASGSAAAGMYLAAKAGSPVDVTFDEPAGQLRVESDPATGITILHGSAMLRGSAITNIQ